MIGNDVVDLAHPATRPGARHPRFDARVFGESERAALAQSAAPDRLRWIFWAAKEAAYKAARKLDSRAVWSPARFAVHLAPAHFAAPQSPMQFAPRAAPTAPTLGENAAAHAAVCAPRCALAGVVLHGAFVFAMRAEADAERVHALAFAARDSAPGAMHCSGVSGEPRFANSAANASAAVRAAARHQLAGWLGLSPGALRIGRRGRIPTLHITGLPGDAADLSLSHHGRFVAWACEIARDALRSNLPFAHEIARGRPLGESLGAARRVENYAR